jgi:hypothetical protein
MARESAMRVIAAAEEIAMTVHLSAPISSVKSQLRDRIISTYQHAQRAVEAPAKTPSAMGRLQQSL